MFVVGATAIVFVVVVATLVDVVLSVIIYVLAVVVMVVASVVVVADAIANSAKTFCILFLFTFHLNGERKNIEASPRKKNLYPHSLSAKKFLSM